MSEKKTDIEYAAQTVQEILDGPRRDGTLLDLVIAALDKTTPPETHRQLEYAARVVLGVLYGRGRQNDEARRERLITAAHDTFWKVCHDDPDPFAYFSEGDNRIDGELPAGVFGQIVDAITAADHA
jgi:hypothetical protein